jgi:dimethylargininase
MRKLIAMTREVSRALAQCELTHLSRSPIDVDRAREQNAAYEEALRLAGCEIRRLPAADDLPDSVFIEDTAIVLDEIAIVTRPGALSRRGECAAVAEALSRYRRVTWIQPPATVDGGDVLVIERTIYVGQSTRTNPAAVDQIAAAASPYGYRVEPVTVSGCLHLKSAVTAVGGNIILINRGWAPPSLAARYETIDVHRDEAYGANAVAVAGRVIYPAAFPRTRERLEKHGLHVVSVDASELAKAEGAVTCCSLIFAAGQLDQETTR